MVWNKRKISWIVAIILLGAILVRLPFLDVYRFEHEMVRDITHSEKILEGEVLLRGVYGSVQEDSSQQSFGPLMHYLIAGSLLLAPNTYWYPLMPSVLVMLLNLGAVWLCYRFGKEFFNEFVGLAAAALFAFSPWFVLHVSAYSSNPNYLPFFIMAFMYCFAKVIVQQKDKYLLPSFVALALATQFHLASLMIFPFVIVAMLIWRRDLFKKKVCYGAIGVAAILYIPYLVYIIKTNSWGNIFAFATARYPGAWLTVVTESLGIPIMYITPYLGSYLLGTVKIMQNIVYVMAGLIVAGMVYAVSLLGYNVLKKKEKEKTTAFILLWWIIPVLVFISIGKNVSPHFFVVILPAQFLVAAVALQKMYQKYAKTTLFVVGAVLFFYIFFVLKVYAVVDQNGGTDSIFGIPYKYRVQVVQEIAKETMTPTIVYYGADKRNMNWLFTHFGLTPKYQYLQSLGEWKEGYLIVDEYDFYSYSDKALSQEEKEKVKSEQKTAIKHINIIRR